MIETAGLEHCLSFINCQLRDGGKSGALAKSGVRRAVTISRQTGCGALVIAEKLAHYLQEHSSIDVLSVDGVRPQSDRQSAGGPQSAVRLAKFMPEDRASEIENILAEVFEVHPPSETISIKPPRPSSSWPGWAT